MKARVFPKLDIPDDLNELGKYIGYYDTVQEQIEFLKYVKLEMDLYYEPRFEIELDAMEVKEYDDWNKILDKKIDFYEKLLEDEEKKKAKNNENTFGLYNFEFDKIKELTEKLEQDEAILYLKYILKEFDREKRENFYLFMTDDEINYFKKNIIITDPNKIHEPPDAMLMGIGAGQKLAIENFEKNINNEIEFIKEKKKNVKTDESNTIKKVANNNDNDRYKECLEKGTQYFIGHKHKRLHFIYFYMEMKKYYGDDIGLIEKVYYKIVTDNPVIKIFGYNYDEYKKKIEKCRNKAELNKIFDVEKNNIEEQLKAINDYKPDYYIKWEQVNNRKIYEDDLEGLGYTNKNDSNNLKYKNAWIRYFIEDVKNEKLREILFYGFSGEMDETEDITNKNSVKIFLENLESELKDYLDKIVQFYLINNANIENDRVDQKDKKKWTMTKSEFARFIQETYEKNKKEYKSLRDANNKLFEEYEFEDKKWTKEKCYDLVRQT